MAIPYTFSGQTGIIPLSELDSNFSSFASTTDATQGSSLVGYLPAGSGAVGITVQAKLRQTVSVKDFGAVGNGTTDDTAAVQAALNYVATVYNGIDVNRFEFYPKADHPPYLAFLGRMSPEKGPHLAIKIAQSSGWTLKMAGKIDPVDIEYFETQIKPYIDGEQIQFLGEANHAQKNILMGKAVATLFPITWKEPFGLVMIESMASGTPVIAMSLGSAPEIISHGRSGFLCHTVEDCLESIRQISQLNRYECREHVLMNFTTQRLSDGYEFVYKKILSEHYSKNSFTRSVAINQLNKH